MNKKRIGIAIAMVIVLGLGFVLYKQTIPDEYVPSDDEIALYVQLDTTEDFGLLLIDYKNANGSGGQGGMSNANKSLLKHNDQLFYTLPKHAFDNPSDVENLSVQYCTTCKKVLKYP